jgi:DNA-binding CsgD family transcriptional regulator
MVTLKNSREISTLAAFAGFFSATLAITLLSRKLLSDSPGHLVGDGKTATPLIVPGEFVLFFVTLALLLIIASRSNDFLITGRGGKVLLYSALIAGLLGPTAFLFEGMSVVSSALVVLSVCVFILLWGACFSTFNHQILLILLPLASVFTGIFTLAFNYVDPTPSMLMISLLFGISWVSFRMISSDLFTEINFIDRARSRERHFPGRGNSFTLFLVGSMFGVIAVMLRFINASPADTALILGGCLILSGLFMLLAYRYFPSRVGDMVKRTLSLTMVLAAAPFPFLGRMGQIACICFLFVVGVVNLILIIDAVLETSRFNQISPFWIVGFEGTIFFLGVVFVLIVASALLFWFQQGLIFSVAVFAALSCALQISVNNQTYPLFPKTSGSIPDSKTTEEPFEATDSNETVGGSALWRERVDVIADQYRLSLRQKEIMELLLKGRNLNYITEYFCISRATAKTHTYNLYRKLGIHSRQELLDLVERDKKPLVS